MSDIYTRHDRFYVGKQATYGTIRNAIGVASVAAVDACKHKSFSAEPNRSRLPASDREATLFRGFRDQSRRGRQGVATASLTVPLISAGAIAVAPDYGPVLESLFGKETITADTSVHYGADNNETYLNPTNPVTCELWHFNQAAKRGFCAFGALANQFRLTAGGDSVDLAVEFLCYGVLMQDRFAAAAALQEKGGLTAWPAEPATRTYTGTEMTGFTGNSVIDGQTYTTVRSFALNINMNRGYRIDRFDDDGSEFFPESPFEGMPEITADISLWSQDSAALDALIAKIEARTAVDATLVLGATAGGGIFTIPLNNLIIPDGKRGWLEEDGDDRKAVTIRGLRAQTTSESVRDEISLTIT